MNNCICCDSSRLQPLLDFKSQPLANSYRKSLKHELPTYPLGVNLCENCFHLQLTHVVNPDELFRDYIYVSGTSTSMREHFDWFSDFVIEYCDPKNVLDIACNDGTQLDYFSTKGVKTFGIDPATNLFNLSSKNHKVVCDYFQSGIYHNQNFDAIVAQNVFAHVQNPLQFLNDCSEIMSENSYLFIQTSQANMVLENQFDTIYHEHISFFNINSFNELCKRSNLHLVDVIKTSIHGVSYIFILSKIPKSPHRVRNLINLEKYQGLQSSNTYKLYQKNVAAIIDDFVKEVDYYRTMGYEIVGYGSAAKGMTFLNATQVQLDYIIDDNQLKQGLYPPGQFTKVVPAEFLQNFSNDVKILFIPLAWNYFQEIKNKILEVRNNPLDLYLKYYPKVELT